LCAAITHVHKICIYIRKACPLSIGIVGFGRFGQFMAKSFAKHGRVIGSSRGDYTHIADEIGVKFIPFSDMESLIVDEDLDVV
jgi:arogenate dehydrogenase (NADP+)